MSDETKIDLDNIETADKSVRIMGDLCNVRGRPTDGYFNSLASPHKDELLRTTNYLLKEDDVVLDVGGNIGITSLFFSKKASRGKVLTFEPGVVNHHLLEANIKENDRSNVTTFNYAIGAEDGSIRFYESAHFGAGSFALGTSDTVKKETFDPRLVAQDVALRSIDSIVDEMRLDRVDLIKVDVEGAERSVIDGARRTLLRFKPTMILEFNTINLIMHQDQSPLGFLRHIIETFDQVFWMDRGSGRLTEIKRPGQVNHFLLYNMRNGMVDNIIGTFRERGLSEESVPAGQGAEFGIDWRDEGFAMGSTVARHDYDWLLGEYNRVKQAYLDLRDATAGTEAATASEPVSLTI